MNAELQKLKESIASIDKQLQKIKADMGPEEEDDDPRMDMMEMMVRHMANYIYGLENEMYSYIGNHQKGHVPKLLSATHVEKFCKACGMENDYEVQKPPVYVSASKHSLVVPLN